MDSIQKCYSKKVICILRLTTNFSEFKEHTTDTLFNILSMWRLAQKPEKKKQNLKESIDHWEVNLPSNPALKRDSVRLCCFRSSVVKLKLIFLSSFVVVITLPLS